MPQLQLLYLLVSVMFGISVANSNEKGDDPESPCRGQKGEKGDYGHPGIRGLRGYKGSLGTAGPKGDVGESGPRGPPGSQGPNGSIGLVGVKGSRGEKGQKGSIGPRGIEGADGEPGVAGHTGPVGPRGSKGEKGVKGSPGFTGVRGPQGIPGEPVDQIKSTLLSLNTTDQPAAHLHGNGKYGTYNSGTLATDWYTGSGQWHSPVLRGGMTYSDGYITVPEEGLYYIYAQILFEPLSGQTTCGFYVYVNNQMVTFVYQSYQSPNGRYANNRYTGLLKMVNKRDRLSLKFSYTCRTLMDKVYSHFGVYRVA